MQSWSPNHAILDQLLVLLLLVSDRREEVPHAASFGHVPHVDFYLTLAQSLGMQLEVEGTLMAHQAWRAEQIELEHLW